MRAGFLSSMVAHIGFCLLLIKGCTATIDRPVSQGVIVPIEIVSTAPESNVRALAIQEQLEENQPEPLEATPAVAQPTLAAATPPRPQQQQRPRADDFDLSAIDQMVNRDRQQTRPRATGANADRNQQGAGQGTQEVVAIDDRIRSLVQRHLARCWRMPVDLPDPDRLAVTVQFELDRNGNLRGQPRVTRPANYQFDPAMRTAVDYALRAVRQCDPYPFPNDPVVGSRYDRWGEQEYTFSVADAQ